MIMAEIRNFTYAINKPNINLIFQMLFRFLLLLLFAITARISILSFCYILISIKNMDSFFFGNRLQVYFRNINFVIHNFSITQHLIIFIIKSRLKMRLYTIIHTYVKTRKSSWNLEKISWFNLYRVQCLYYVFVYILWMLLFII